MSLHLPLPCPEKPERLAGAALGQYHCPCCLEMQMAGCPHFSMAVEGARDGSKDPDAYQREYGHEWPFWTDDGNGIWP